MLSYSRNWLKSAVNSLDFTCVLADIDLDRGRVRPARSRRGLWRTRAAIALRKPPGGESEREQRLPFLEHGHANEAKL